MHHQNPPTPRLTNKAVDESSIEDYDDALFDVEDGDMECAHEDTIQNIESIIHCISNELSRPSSATADWEEPESWMASAQNSESFPVSTPGSSSGASPLTGTSSQGVSPGVTNYEEAFNFSIPEDTGQTVSPMDDVLQVEKDFMEYVMSFPLGVASVPPPPLPATSGNSTRKAQSESNPKVGLDHLDNLCKLMEQLSDLKEANLKLKRRVQYLEDIKTLHEIHKEMVGERKTYSSGLSDEDFQRMKQKDADEKEPSEDSRRSETPDRMLGLYRSKTANVLGPSCDYSKGDRGHKSRSSAISKERRERSKSVGHAGHAKGKKRPSRWSKVKEVLGIEKMEEFSTGEGEKSDDREKSKKELTRRDSEKSKSSIKSSRSHSNALSSRSFSEAERQGSNASNIVSAKKSGTLDSKTAKSMMEHFEKEDIGPKKSPKTPWGKMKTMIQIRRDNRQQKSESSSSSPRDAKVATTAIERRGPRLNHNRPAMQDVEFTSISQKELQNDRSPRHHRLSNGSSDPCHHRQKSPQKPGHRKESAPLQESESEEKGYKDDDQYSGQEINDKSPYSRNDEAKELQKALCATEGKRKKSKPRPLAIECAGEGPQLPCDEDSSRSPGMSPQTQKKWMWLKMKGVLKGKREEDEALSGSLPSSPSSATDCMAFDFDLEKDKEGKVCLGFPTPCISDPCATPSTTVTELLRELQQNLSDDFNKKMEEWQRCRAEGIQKIACQEVERKDSFGKIRKLSKLEKKTPPAEKTVKGNYSPQKKDLNWLEKEQQKVDREILRLSKEKQKFEKRSFRLKQLKEAMTDGQKKEVLVKTSAGEFRFEGISDDFTKKLYEWETKKGVNPELSTIALLDESLKLPAETVATVVCSASIGSNSTRPSPEPSRSCYQMSRASSEPDLSSTQKETGPNSQGTQRSKSGDTLLASEPDIIATIEPEQPSSAGQGSRDTIQHVDDNYYSLLEENMYLLDQLKEKEEICSHLQNELDRLDDKTEKTNRTHQEEMEKYRQKLWEIHMSRPRDLQGSLHLISELKSRIEELQKCSDKLKTDRERLEESFRYHSNQQARLADDLIRKVRDYQEGASWGHSRGCRRKWRKQIKCDQASISRIHDLSTRLLQQARDVEQTLMERTRHVCHLRWELLHRDMSAVLLQAALHRVTSQGEPVTILPTWDKRRNRFKNIKAWSVDTTTRRPSEDLVTDDWLQERLRQLSMTPYNEWTNIDFTPNDLMATAHELKRETLRLAICRPVSDKMSDSEDKKSATCSAESEMADSDRCYDTGSAVNSRSSSFSSGPGGLRGSHSDTRLYERTKTLRRNSSSSMSCVEASDSSSIHESDKIHLLAKRYPWRTQWRSLDNVSSSCSSRSSVLDDDMVKNHWKSPKSAFRDLQPQEESSHNQPLQVKYGSFREVDEETEELKRGPSAEWGNQCLITPKPVHLTRISDAESEKNTYSPPPAREVRYELSMSKATQYVPGGRLVPYTSYKVQQSFGSVFPNTSQTMANTSASLQDQNTSYKSVTEGSMESLDKYETAIRDEDLTGSDENFGESSFHQRKTEMETFSEFEKDLQQRTAKNIPSPIACSSPHQSISDYIDRGHTTFGSVPEYSNSNTPGSPNITKIKYRGTKGFGHSPRLEYIKRDDKSASESFHFLKMENEAEL